MIIAKFLFALLIRPSHLSRPANAKLSHKFNNGTPIFRMFEIIKSMFRVNVLVNAMLFNGVWIACVAGSAKQLIWPAALSCAILAAYQLHPSNRHSNDIKLVILSVILGLIVDTIWVQFGFMDFTEKRPFSNVAPAWIIILWVGFALTVNHSLKWLTIHPLLPAITGAIAAPLTYFAGIKIGAVEYTASITEVSIGLAVAWAIALTILVEVGKREDNTKLASSPQLAE